MKIRIVCKTPPRQPHWHPCVQPIATYEDARVVAFDDDGTELELEGVTFVRWEVRAGEMAVAHLEVAGAEIDAEALVELAAEKKAKGSTA